MERKQIYVFILTNSRLEEMAKGWRKLLKDLRGKGIEGEVWLANEKVSCALRR